MQKGSSNEKRPPYRHERCGLSGCSDSAYGKININWNPRMLRVDNTIFSDEIKIEAILTVPICKKHWDLVTWDSRPEINIFPKG